MILLVERDYGEDEEDEYSFFTGRGKYRKAEGI
jgi:hypothetical protein